MGIMPKIRFKNMYLMSQGNSAATLSKQAIYGALTLYLDFINLFIFLLRIFGQRR